MRPSPSTYRRLSWLNPLTWRIARLWRISWVARPVSAYVPTARFIAVCDELMAVLIESPLPAPAVQLFDIAAKRAGGVIPLSRRQAKERVAASHHGGDIIVGNGRGGGQGVLRHALTRPSKLERVQKYGWYINLLIYSLLVFLLFVLSYFFWPMHAKHAGLRVPIYYYPIKLKFYVRKPSFKQFNSTFLARYSILF